MLNRISQRIHQYSKSWLVLVSLLIFLLFIIFVLPTESKKSQSNTNSTASPDTSLFYNTSELYQMAEDYGAEGRAAYIRARFSFDLIWPIVYTIFLLTGISWLSQRTLSTASPFQIINLAPLFAIILDLLENISTSIVMDRYPQLTLLIDFLAPVFSALKWIFVIFSFLLLLGLCMMYLSKKFFTSQR